MTIYYTLNKSNDGLMSSSRHEQSSPVTYRMGEAEACSATDETAKTLR